jgi:hypothetical protein
MSIERVNYFERQFLRVEDFQDEQSYQVSMRRRHNISHHTWGIVEGLEPQLAEGSLVVSPGLAIDGFGRELILETIQPLRGDAFVDLDTNELQVWMDYATTAAGAPPKGYAACGTNGSGQFYRVVERPRLRLSKPDRTSTPRLPGSVIPADRTFDATRAAPEDRNWPVFLGTVTANPKTPDTPFTIDLSGRPYAGLIGEGVTAPSGRARVQIGAESVQDQNRFAVFIPAADATPRLAIQQDGKLSARGETTVEGNLTVTGGALEIGVGPAASPQPWRVYRVEAQDAEGTSHNELRIEMEGGDNGLNQIVFGAWSAKENKFKPCLTIAEDGTVTVSGNLVIKGKLDVNPENIVAGQLTTDAKAFLASGVLAGIGAGRVQQPPGDLREPTPSVGVEARLRELAKEIAHPDPERLRKFSALKKREFKDVPAKHKRSLED